MEERFVKANELMVKDEFMNKLGLANSHEDVQKLFAENGVELSLDDIEAMCQQSIALSTNGELSEKDMDQVAGGYVVGTIACFYVASVGLGFFCQYGKRTLEKALGK